MPLKLPSLHYLLEAARQAVVRFPLTILSSVLAAIMAILLIETDEMYSYTKLNLMLTAALGIPAYLGAGLLGQRLDRRSTYLLYIVSTILLVLVYFSLPDENSTFNTSQGYIRYVIYNLIAHLVVAFAPFIKRGELNGFWNYNKTLFLRFLLSVLYSGVLYAGLALALLTVDELFNADVDPKRYGELFVLIIWVFNTWFFVFGLPRNFQELEENENYPRGLRIFTQFVLLPLIALYLIILYAYGGKILLTWDWPRGLVSYMVMAFSVVGILTMLLVHPYAKQTEYSWIGTVRRIFYILLFPLVILLFLAIGMRISMYGYTVNRYIILLMGVWILLAAAFATWRPAQIKFIPASLAVLLFLVSFGYWGMFSVSERDQVDRLEEILQNNGLLENGRIVREVQWVTDSLPEFNSPEERINDHILSDSLHNEVYSIMDYLDEYHGYEEIRPWFTQDIHSLIKKSVEMTADSNKYMQYRDEAEIYMKTMGLQSGMKYTRSDEQGRISMSHMGSVYSISGYDLLLELPQANLASWDEKGRIQQRKRQENNYTEYPVIFTLDTLTMDFGVTLTDSSRFTFNLSSLVEEGIRHIGSDSYVVPMQPARMTIPDKTGSSMLVIRNITLVYPESSGESWVIESIDGFILSRREASLQ